MRVICIQKPQFRDGKPISQSALTVGSVYTVIDIKIGTTLRPLDPKYKLLELFDVAWFWSGLFREITPAEEEELQNELIEAI